MSIAAMSIGEQIIYIYMPAEEYIYDKNMMQLLINYVYRFSINKSVCGGFRESIFSLYLYLLT